MSRVPIESLPKQTSCSRTKSGSQTSRSLGTGPQTLGAGGIRSKETFYNVKHPEQHFLTTSAELIEHDLNVLEQDSKRAVYRPTHQLRCRRCRWTRHCQRPAGERNRLDPVRAECQRRRGLTPGR